LNKRGRSDEEEKGLQITIRMKDDNLKAQEFYRKNSMKFSFLSNNDPTGMQFLSLRLANKRIKIHSTSHSFILTK
jgi:hypothetical protein